MKLHLARLGSLAALALLTACSDPINQDLKALNAAGQAAMEAADIKGHMGKITASSTIAERASVLRETAKAISEAQNGLAAAPMKSKKVRDIQTKMLQGFALAASGAAKAADGMETSASDALVAGQTDMRAGQMTIMVAGSELVMLAKKRSVDLASPQ